MSKHGTKCFNNLKDNCWFLVQVLSIVEGGMDNEKNLQLFISSHEG